MKKIYLLILVLIFMSSCTSNKKKSENKILGSEKKEETILEKREEIFLNIKKGSFVYEKIETHLNSFFITKDKIFIKKSENDIENLNNLNLIEIAKYCNKRSIAEGLIPYYFIKGKNIYENKNNNGYRLPSREEYIYCFSYNEDDFYTFYPQKELVLFDSKKENKSNYFKNLDFEELKNEDIILGKNKEYSGFRLVKKDKISNTLGTKYTTRKDYDFEEAYEIYSEENLGIKFVYPKNWGKRYISKNMDMSKRERYEDIEKGDFDFKNGVIFYELNCNSERIFIQKFFIYKNKKLNKKDENILEYISKKFNINIERLKIFEKNNKIYIYIDEKNKTKNLFIIDGNNIFEISFETINEYTDIPESIVLNVFSSINF